MDFIIADAQRMELGYLSASAEVDLDLSYEADNKNGVNDGELTVEEDIVTYGQYLFCPGSEYGGRILDLKRKTSSASKTWYFDTWRRMLGQSVIEPPEGTAYYLVEPMDANAMLKEVFSGRFGDFFIVPEYLSGIEVSGQFDRYTTLLDGTTKLLKAHGAKLKITTVQGGPGEPFHVQVEAVPIVDYSEEIEYSQDNRVNITLRDNRRGINHLICLGSGELTERMVRHLYVQEDGTIGDIQYYFGLDERVAVHDYPNAEDENELLKSGKEKLESLMSYKKLDMTVDDLDVDIGDIVGGRDRETGLYLAKPIVNKVLKIKKGKETITYKVKGDN